MTLSRVMMLCCLLTILGTASLAPAAMGGTPPRDDSAAAGALDVAALLADLTTVDAMAKVEPELRAAVDADQSQRLVPIVIQSVGNVELDSFATAVHRFRWPAGEHVAILEVRPSDIPAIAKLPGVFSVDSAEVDLTRQRPPEPGFEPVLPSIDVEALMELAQNAPPWRPAPSAGLTPMVDGDATIDGAARPSGWYDANNGHAASEAWELGYRGEGVTVAVLDNAVDFAHPDLQGTWRVLPDGHPHSGWAQAFDPPAGLQLTLDINREPDVRSTRRGASGFIEAYQTANITTTGTVTEPVSVACFQPLNFLAGQGIVLAEDCVEHVVPGSSQSGTVRFGHHPDTLLRSLTSGDVPEYAGVLVVDEAEAGVYDTVYLDMDGDRDFTDEKPLSKADPVAYRDVNDDGYADLSGGLLYWISDGETPPPGAWVWGLEEMMPESGHMVAFLYAGGGHGTLCASNVVSQGVLGVPEGRDLRFRDLPGDQQPLATNLGMAPEARMVSIGDVYVGGRVLFASAWRYAVLGHDPDRDDDKIQITSNSYGWSDVDIDGWEDDARLIDHYVRTFSPETSFLFSTGNGGPGYGTLAPPSPSVGMGIGASTQMGSTGMDSITDTNQITFGDFIPFSNRGPGADGRVGPTVGANGAYASGAVPLNQTGGTDGRFANGTWGGTSRSGPVANGVLALSYQAFREKHDRWPNWEEARSVLMAGARYNGYDVFTMGAGVIDAADSARISGGHHGVYAMPSEWTAGAYRGQRHDAYAKLMMPGASDTIEITLHNPSAHDIDVSLKAMTSRRIGSHDDAITTDREEQSPSSPAPDYLLPLNRDIVPEGTELMIARGAWPHDQFDPDGNYTADNYFIGGVVQHTDINGNGLLWNDTDGNGVVNHRAMAPTYVTFDHEDQALNHDATEGAITRSLEPGESIVAELAWYGLACNVEGERPPPAQELSERIALIERGDCTFAEKILNAQAEGAIAVIVFSDDRPVVVMGGDGAGIEIPGVMIARMEGLAIREVLDDGTPVSAGIYRRDAELKGLDGGAPLIYEESEIEQYEYMRLNYENGVRNHFAVPVHHPLERWADGLYLGLWHSGRSTVVTNTNISLRYDFYAYEPWDVISLESDSVTVPAGGTATVEVSMSLPEDTPYGAIQGAIFADYERGPGDQPVTGPGGWEPEDQRIVIPINASVAATYDWEGAITFGGASADDRYATYNNGAVQGTYKWNWRPESGDWRFFFVDALAPADGSFWITRTKWDDDGTGQTDIDTQLLGPTADRFSDPDHQANAEDDSSDPAWYGPGTMEVLARSRRTVIGSTWRFHTSSGEHEDWLATPADRQGLHEVLLHNVLFSGLQFEVPFETTLSSARVSAGSVTLIGDECSSLTIESQMDLPGFSAVGFGLSEPATRLIDQPIEQDNPDDRSSSSFKHDLVLTTDAPRFVVTLSGKDDDDLDLIVLYDANGDGTFSYPGERIAESTGADSNERIELVDTAPAGAYQIWVHGWAVQGDESTFDLTIEVVSGDDVQIAGVPETVLAGEPVTIEVCADTTGVPEDFEGPLAGIVAAGPGGAPRLFEVPLTWLRTAPTIYLPLVAHDADLRAADEPMP